MTDYEVVSQDLKIPTSHLCSNCGKLLFDVYECSNRCAFYCSNHQPNDRKCEICLEKLEFNPKMNELIKKRYKIKCVHCDKELMFGELKEHNQKECQRKCPNDCGKIFLESELENHLNTDCCNSIVECIGCFEVDKRGLINLHQHVRKIKRNFLEKIK
jgi:hypothetical protein